LKPTERSPFPCRVGLLTAGDDKPYAHGLAEALNAEAIPVDFVGSDALDSPELRALPFVRFLNLRGDQRENVSVGKKAIRILTYYARLMRYAMVGGAPILHILWNNRFELFDRTMLMCYYRALGKRIVLTAHNVNAAKRDGRDSALNRASLRMQYQLCHHIFVHTEAMKTELVSSFEVDASRVSVIPFGLNDTIPKTSMTRSEARRRLGIDDRRQTMLCFGQVAPYKGIEYLIEAVTKLSHGGATNLTVIIAGKIKRGSEDYWRGIDADIDKNGVRDRVIRHIQFIPDDAVEVYFKAADVVVLPYTNIFQSGVPFLAFSFGLPVVATDVGSLAEDVHDGVNGFICAPRSAEALASGIQRFFDSALYREGDARRDEIRRLAAARHSWSTVSDITRQVYAQLLTK